MTKECIIFTIYIEELLMKVNIFDGLIHMNQQIKIKLVHLRAGGEKRKTNIIDLI